MKWLLAVLAALALQAVPAHAQRLRWGFLNVGVVSERGSANHHVAITLGATCGLTHTGLCPSVEFGGDFTNPTGLVWAERRLRRRFRSATTYFACSPCGAQPPYSGRRAPLLFRRLHRWAAPSSGNNQHVGAERRLRLASLFALRLAYSFGGHGHSAQGAAGVSQRTFCSPGAEPV